MIRELFVVVVTVTVVVHEASAVPGHRRPTIPLSQTNSESVISPRRDITHDVNSKLQEILANINEPMILKNPLEIRVNQDYVAHIYLKMDGCKLSGVTDFTAHDCTLDLVPLQARGNISISIKSPKVTLNTDQYFINGTMVDHVELFGHGPGMISVDDMDIKVEGSAKVTFHPFSVVFDTAVLDLEMWRWTVNLEDLMPGTDLGTVFNEFFSMYGPAIFDVIENNINKNDKLLNFLNNIFSPHPSSK